MMHLKTYLYQDILSSSVFTRARVCCLCMHAHIDIQQLEQVIRLVRKRQHIFYLNLNKNYIFVLYVYLLYVYRVNTK